MRAYISMMISWTQRDDFVQLRFNSRATYIYFSSELFCVIVEMYAHMLNQTEIPALLRSGFTLARVNHMGITISRDRIIAVSSYIPLPKLISSKVAMINPKNDDMPVLCGQLSQRFIIMKPHSTLSAFPNSNPMAIGMTGVTYLFQWILEIFTSGKTQIAFELTF